VIPAIDPRVELGGALTAAEAAPFLTALDERMITVRVASGDPRDALLAAALLGLLRRSHANVALDGDADLPRNPWGASTLVDRFDGLQQVAPAPFVPASSRVDVVIGAAPHPQQDSSADTDRLFVYGDAWTAWVVADPADLLTVSETGPEPYGAFLAAGLAASVLFQRALRSCGLPAGPETFPLIWNVVDHRRRPAAQTDRVVPDWPQLALLGAGTVGSAVAATLAVEDLRGLTAFAIDPDHFDPQRNPFRYPASTSATAGDKSAWVAGLLTSAGARAEGVPVRVGEWVRSADSPGFDGVAVGSVDTVEGRFQTADLLARTHVSVAVDTLALHVQREVMGDGLRCPFCDFVDLRGSLSQVDVYVQMTGLDPARVVALLREDGRLVAEDLARVTSMRPIASADELVGRRLADILPRIYAQAAIQVRPDADPIRVSAPHVSWIAGVLAAAELAKQARGLPLLDRRVELDLHGPPDDFVHRLERDRSGRCPCADPVRRRWMDSLYGVAATA
jgi:hypothetical protein